MQQKELSILTPTEPWADFASAYLAMRQKEWRLPDDALLANLPQVPKNHPHAKAWRMRAKATQKLLRVLNNNILPNESILDIGCGNGWLSNRVAQAGFNVFAIDINLPELQQAHRVFNLPNLQFAFADMFSWQPPRQFTAALFASSFQYFEDPNRVLRHLFTANPSLKKVIISDSPFYLPHEKEAARQRSAQYYQKHGYPKMAAHYHHHSLEDLQFDFKIHFQPLNPIIRKLFGGVPFPIVVVSRPQ